MSLEREVPAVEDHANERYRAIIRGVRWLFAKDQTILDWLIFSEVIVMLNELTLTGLHPTLERIVHDIIVKVFSWSIRRLPKLYSAATIESYEDFLSLLPAAYRHKVPIEPLKLFAEKHFANVSIRDRLQEFRLAAKKTDYDRLCSIIIDSVFFDLCYRAGAAADFRLPPNHCETYLTEAAAIPFIHHFNKSDDRKLRDFSFFDQNYYATHVILASTRYGYEPFPDTATNRHMLRYAFITISVSSYKRHPRPININCRIKVMRYLRR